jgi:hypothetical protein
LGKRPEKLPRIPVTLKVQGSAGIIGSEVVVHDPAGQRLAGQFISGGDGRGGQAPPFVRFALPPGKYQIEVRYTSGVRRGQEITVGGSPLQQTINDQTPALVLR